MEFDYIAVLIAFGVVAAVGLVLGIILSLISHFFSVKEDETVKKVRECLPGINCGACGYKGCDDYALAVAKGKAKVNLCIPGADDVAKQLADILGVEAEKIKDVVAFVHCNGNCTATENKADYEGLSTCKAVTTLYKGPTACAYSCLGLGDCAKACPNNAICLKDGIAHVDTSRCVGCKVCVATCPKGIISMVPQHTEAAVMCSNKEKGADARKNCKNACIGCKKCEKVCPTGAITVKDNLASIDYDKCSFCLACMENCVTGCLKKVYFPDLEKPFKPNN